jgi:cytochrome b561
MSSRGQNTVDAAGAIPRVDMPWMLAGAVLLAAFLLQAALGWRWESLAVLQESEIYKQLTGVVLLLFFLLQWRLTLARVEGGVPAGSRLLGLHRDRGALAPLLLYLHAIGLGHAYLRVMSLSFLALLALGLLQRPIARLGRSWATTAWLVTHVALASMLAFLVGYHAFNAFYYE